MTTPHVQAAIDFNAKLRLERKLLGQLARFHDQQARGYMRALARGKIYDFDADEPRLREILERHMNLTGEVFVDRINAMVIGELKGLTPSAAMTFSEIADQMVETKARKRVPVVTSGYYSAQSSSTARAVTETSKKQANQALVAARARRPDAADIGVEETEIASTTGAVFRRMLRGRETGIARLNTQGAAESAKLTQIQLLRGEEPSFSGGGPTTGTKEWANLGDSKVRIPPGRRFNHLTAEQEVPINQPFIVNGEQLRFPGDQSLGASLGNVCSCRCSATYDIAQTARIVKAKGSDPRAVRLPSAPKATARVEAAEKALPPTFEEMIKVHGEVGETYKRKLKEAWDLLTDDVKIALREAGVEIRLAKKIGNTIDEMRNSQGVLGVYRGGSKGSFGTRQIGVPETVAQRGGRFSISKDPGFTLLHEIGHAMDDILGNQGLGSFSNEWRKLWKGVNQNLSKGSNDRSLLNYFVGHRSLGTNFSESFAESFANAIQNLGGLGGVKGRGGDMRNQIFRREFKEMIKFVEDTVKKVNLTKLEKAGAFKIF